MTKTFAMLGAVAAAALAVPANAAVLTFTISGDYNGSFQLDSNPTPDFVADGLGFIVYDVEGFDDALLGVADVTFYNAALGGGLTIADYYAGVSLFGADGPQLYTGLESNPTFLTGTFALYEIGTTTQIATLTITDATAAVPEPASWALMIGGFGLVGGAMRRRQQVRTSVTYA